MESMKKLLELISELARLKDTRSINESQTYFYVLEKNIIN